MFDDDINFVAYGGPLQKTVTLNLPNFLIIPKGVTVAVIGFAIWRAHGPCFIKKIPFVHNFQVPPSVPETKRLKYYVS